MYYYFKTDVDCKACLDNILFDLLEVAVRKVVYYSGIEGSYKIVIQSKNTLDELTKIFEKMQPVVINILEKEVLLEKQFISLSNSYNSYTESFF